MFKGVDAILRENPEVGAYNQVPVTANRNLVTGRSRRFAAHLGHVAHRPGRIFPKG